MSACTQFYSVQTTEPILTKYTPNMYFGSTYIVYAREIILRTLYLRKTIVNLYKYKPVNIFKQGLEVQDPNYKYYNSINCMFSECYKT